MTHPFTPSGRAMRTSLPPLAMGLIVSQIRHSAGVLATVGVIARYHPELLEDALTMAGETLRQAEIMRWRGWNVAGVPIRGR